MALRSKQTVAIAVAGSTIAHSLASTPDEVFVLPTVSAGAGQTYRFSASDGTNVYLAQGTSATSADVVCAVNHTMVK
jgi:hypothetical protein